MKDIKIIHEIPEKLLEEAIESLDLGLEFIERSWEHDNEIRESKQATCYVFRFVEYILKYFVAQINPILVFQKVFSKDLDPQKDKAISFEEALNFYINHLKFKKESSSVGYEKNELKRVINKLRGSRNRIVHFLYSPIDSPQEMHAQVLKLMYYILLEHEVDRLVHEKLSPESFSVLNELINIEKQKEEVTDKKIKDYLMQHKSSRPKDSLLDPTEEELIFDCSECDRHKMLFDDKKELFVCKYCGNEEAGDYCILARRCNGGLVPSSCLFDWNEEGGACAMCQDFRDLP